MEPTVPFHAGEQRRVPRVMRVTVVVTCTACVILLYALYHHWAAPYEIKADLLYGRIVAVVAVSMVLLFVGWWLYRVSGRRTLLAATGSLLMVPAAVFSILILGMLLNSARPIVASGDYDAAATEFSAHFAQLSGPRPEINHAKEMGLRAINEPSSAEEIRQALSACREIIAAADRDADEITQLQDRGREMFKRRGVGAARVKAYFDWKEPLMVQVYEWRDSTTLVATRYRDLERQLMQRLGDTPP